MRHLFTLLLILTCFAALFLICYAPALFLDRQFGFRDAGTLLLSAQSAGSGGMEPGAVAAVGARGERGDAAPRQPDGGGSLSGKAGLRRAALCLGSARLHRGSFGAGVFRACSS